jgi:FAD/FMN-containing dehydrogenase
MSVDAAFADVLTEIKALLGPHGVIEDPAQKLPYETSMRTLRQCPARLVARPADTRQVADLVRLCARYRLPIVPQGGNTGLVDGGIPSPEGREIVVSLARLDRIRELDPVGAIVTVEAGVVLQRLREAAAAAGLLFPLSMGSQGTMQIGGAISTNAGGTAVLRYGTTRQLVLGLEVVLPDGDILSNLKKLIKDNTGYNLSQPFIGAEGTLGIVTAATLRLFPAPRQELTAFAALPDAGAALALLQRLRGVLGEFLSTFELISRPALDAVLRHVPGARRPLATQAPWYALIECGATSPDLPLRGPFEALAAEALDQGGLLDAAIAESSAQARAFWALREAVPDGLRRSGPVIVFDIALPIAEIADFLRIMGERLTAREADLIPMPFGHVGDGNLHYNLVAPAALAPAAFLALKRDVEDLVFGEVERRQGSVSAEHGIGLLRKAALGRSKSEREIALMRRIKQAFDPQGIMNPGKIFDIKG